MKTPAILAAFFVTAFPSLAQLPLEDISPHFSANMPIIWQATTNHLPKSFWTYKRLPPRPFPKAVISNVIVLASLQDKAKGFPKPSTKDFSIAEDRGPNYPGGIPVIFSISPRHGVISYGRPNRDNNSTGIPADEILVRRAWACAAQLGVDPTQVTLKNLTTSFNKDENFQDLTNQIAGRGVFLSRKLDDILFWGSGEDGDNGGFWMEFGSRGQVRAFSLVWPDLKRNELQQTASPRQIIACIRAFKTMSLPNGNEPDYFQRLKNLGAAKKLTITQIMPYYNEGIYGETPTDDSPPKFVAPMAQLEAVADFGETNLVIRLLSPILETDVARLLKTK